MVKKYLFYGEEKGINGSRTFASLNKCKDLWNSKWGILSPMVNYIVINVYEKRTVGASQEQSMLKAVEDGLI